MKIFETYAGKVFVESFRGGTVFLPNNPKSMLAWCFKFVPIFTSYAERHAEIVLVRPYKCEPECEWIRDLERRGSAVFIFMHHLSGNPGVVWSLQGFYWALFCLSERYPVPEFALGLRCTLTRGNNEIGTGISSSSGVANRQSLI